MGIFSKDVYSKETMARKMETRRKNGWLKNPEETKRKTRETRMKNGGYIISDEQKIKISNTKKRLFSEGKLIHPMLGKHHKEESIEKMSESHKGRHLSPNTEFKKGNISWNEGKKLPQFSGKNHPRYGKHHTEETKLKISLSRRGKYLSKETLRKISKALKGRKISKEQIEKFKLFRKNQVLPLKDSSIEIKIQDFLKILGIEFYSHFWVSNIENRYQCDIFIPSIKTVIECDGDYWHGNPKIFNDNKLTERILKQREKDKIRTKQLLEKGYKVIRLWENEIRKMELDDFKNKILGGENGSI